MSPINTRSLKIWAEVVISFGTIAGVIVAGLVLALAAWGPFETEAQHVEDIQRVETTAEAAQLYREDTRRAVLRLVCENYADRGEVSLDYCRHNFPVSLPGLQP